MTIKEKIEQDIKLFEGHGSFQSQLYEYIQLLKKNLLKTGSNKNELMKLAGTVSDENAKEMLDIIKKEFNNIEGEW